MLSFGVWSPSKEAFFQAWTDAGIGQMVEQDGQQVWQYNEPYRGAIQTTADSWSGIIVKTPAVLDEDGVEITPAVMVDGWHCNVRVHGQALIDQFIQGLPQTDEDGNLLSIWERTHAAAFFQLTEQPADPATGFPAGFRAPSGVTYADIQDFSSPANVWA